MRTLRLFSLIFSLILASQLSINAQVSSSAVEGEWMTEDRDSKVRVYKEGGKYYGEVSWLEDPIDEETGKPFVDSENPDSKLKNRGIMGLLVLKDFKFDGDQWEGGTIYDPKNGKTYKCYMEVEGQGKLKIRGYIGKSWMGLGRTTYWTR